MSYLWDMLLAAIFILSFLLVLSVILYFSYHQARKLGYRPPAVAAMLLGGFLIGIATTAAMAPANTTNLLLFWWNFFYVPLLLSAAAIGIILLVLPRRAARVFGERKVRFPFRRLGQALIVLGAVSVTLVGVTRPAKFGAALSLGIMLGSAGLYLIRRGRNVLIPPMEEILRDDPRPPVLYLRAFNQESQFFIIGTKAEYGAWSKSLHGEISKRYQNIGITLEEYLAEEITDSIGPFVALGSPEDYLAPPGALRVYAKDEDWKLRFDELARRSAGVIVEVSKSDNLRWELEHLQSEGLQEKLFILTRPSPTKGSKLSWAFWEMLWRLKGIRSMTWQEFREDLTKLGYEIGFGDPGPGAVLSFNMEGRGTVLTTGANWPTEFVEPIRAWIAGRKRAPGGLGYRQA